MAATLILEAVVVLLAIPVVGAVGGGLNAVSLGYLIGLTVLLVALAGLQGRPWAIWVNLGVQAILLAGFAVYPAVGFIGLLFTGVVGPDRLLACRGAAASGARAVTTGLIGARFCTLCAVTERTLVLIKPDGVERRLIGEVISRIEQKGLTITALQLRNVSQELAAQHYAEHEAKPSSSHYSSSSRLGRWSQQSWKGRERSLRSGSSLAAPTRLRRPRPAPSAAISDWKRSSIWCTGPIRATQHSARSRCGSRALAPGR